MTPRRIATQFLVSLAVLALVTAACVALGVGAMPAAFIHLLAIVLLSLRVGFVPLAVVSVLAVAALNYFFMPPAREFRLNGASNVVELGVFVVAALVITRVVNRRRATAELLAERARLLDLTHDAVFVRDVDGRIIYWNRGAEELYGWTSEEAVGRIAHDLLQTVFPEPFASIEAELHRTGRWQGELLHTRRDGRRAVVATRWTVQQDPAGNISALLVAANDITARKEADAALRESEEQWKAVFEHNPTMYFIVDPAGTVVSVNPFGAEQLGYTVDELVGQPAVNVFFEADRDAAVRNFAACLEHPGETIRWELRKIRKDGTMLCVRETAKAMELFGRGPVVLVVCEDITERKRAEASIQFFKEVIDQTQDPIFWQNPAEGFRFVYVNDAACRHFGLPAEKLLTVSVPDVDPNFPFREMERYWTDLKRSKSRTIDTVHRRSTGDLVPVEVTTNYVVSDGKEYVAGTIRDISQRKRAEEALRESEERYRALIELSPQAVWMARADGGLTYVSQWWLNYTGLTLEQSQGDGWLEAVPAAQRAQIRRAWMDAVAAGNDYDAEVPFRRAADGRDRWHSVRGIATRDAEGRTVRWIGIAIDVHDRREAEEVMRRSEAYLNEAQQMSHTGSWVLNLGTRKIVYWSQELFRILGFDPDRGIPSTEELLRRVHPDDRTKAAEWFARAVREHIGYDEEFRVVHRDGTVRYVHSVCVPSRDAAGKPVELLGTVMDIAERKEAEDSLQKAQAALTHVTRVTTLGEVTASFAHELNQPLAAIVNNASACLGLLPDGRQDLGDVRGALEDIVADAERASAVIERVRRLAKRSTPEHLPLRLADVVADVIALAASESVARRVTIRTDVPADLPVVVGDRVQLQQVLLNLVVNAMDAMSGVEEPERALAIRGARDAVAGTPGVTISVEDRGIGLRDAPPDRLFEPFYTTKSHGMGLGLAISRSIIEAHGGRLWAESNAGRGATFCFRLPVASASAAA